MKSLQERQRENIDRWEVRGRGVLTYPEPVSPRPPFAPFPGHRLKRTAAVVDSVKPTAISSFLARMTSLIRDEGKSQTEAPQPEPENDDGIIEPHWRGEESELVELQMKVPAEMNAARETMVSFLAGVSRIQEPVVFEIVGTANKIWTQWVADPRGAPSDAGTLSGGEAVTSH